MVAGDKTKHYLVGIGKVVLLSLTFGYIFFRLRGVGTEEWQNFSGIMHSQPIKTIGILLVALALAAVNWVLEILKWQRLASLVSKTDFKSAARQTLVAFSLSLATPARAGEYGIKALFFEKAQRKKVMVLHLFSNISQLIITFLLGLVGLVFLLKNAHHLFSFEKSLMLLGAMVGLLVFSFLFRKNKIFIRGFNLEALWNFFAGLPFSVKGIVFLLSLARYVVFSLLFYFLLVFFGMSFDFFSALMLIFSMYLFISVVPAFFILDVVIRGGVAVWLFSMFGIPDLTVLSAVGMMWILNFVLPAILGSFRVFKFQPARG